MTPEEAKAILDGFANTTNDHHEEIYVWALMQLEITGRPWPAEGPPTTDFLRRQQRSKKLAQLHAEEHLRKHTGQDFHAVAAEIEEVMEEIYKEAVAELEEHGLPDAWKSAREN